MDVVVAISVGGGTLEAAVGSSVDVDGGGATLRPCWGSTLGAGLGSSLRPCHGSGSGADATLRGAAECVAKILMRWQIESA